MENKYFKLHDAVLKVCKESMCSVVKEYFRTPNSSANNRVGNITTLQVQGIIHLYPALEEPLAGNSKDQLEQFYGDIRIRQLLHEHYVTYCTENNELPTMKNIFEFIEKKVKFKPTYTFVKHIIKQCGYVFLDSPTTNITYMMERSSVIYKRTKYFRKITQYRAENRDICYIGKRVFTCKSVEREVFGLRYAKYLMKNIIAWTNRGRLTFTCYTDKNVIEWAIDILLPFLTSPSVIVIPEVDFGLEGITKPNMRSHILEITHWLEICNMPFDKNMSKFDLVTLVEETTPSKTKYQLDDILRSHGHEVLRLPFSIHHLSIVEQMWSMHTTNKLINESSIGSCECATSRCTKKFCEGIWSSDNNNHYWPILEKNIVELEKEFIIKDRQIDHKIDGFLDKIC